MLRDTSCYRVSRPDKPIHVTERSNAATEERLKSGHAVGSAASRAIHQPSR